METVNQSIENRTVKGIAWRYAEEISTKAVSFIVSVILARLLVPEDYSLVSIAAIIISFVDTFIDSGLSMAIIQKGNADKEDYGTFFAFSLFISTFIYTIIFFFAPLLSKLYNEVNLTEIVRVLCLVIIVKSVKNVFFTRIRTTLQFKKMFFCSFTGTFLSAIIGILFAFKGFGAWALVAQQLTDAIIDTVFLWALCDIKVVPHFSLTRFNTLFSYSSKILVARVFGQVSNALSPVLISLRYSVLDLTYYSKAKGLSGYMVGFIESPLSQVLFPALSQIKDKNDQLLNFLRKFYRALYLFSLPALCGLYVVAEDFVLLFLTEKWLCVVPYMRVFLIGMIFNKNIQGITAIGRSDLYMKAQICYRALGVIYLLIALILFDNPISIAWIYVPTSATYFFIQVYLEHKYLGYKAVNQIKDILPSLIPALIMAFSVHLIAKNDVISSLGVFCGLIIQVLFGVVIYSVIVAIYIKKTGFIKFKQNI